MLTSGLAVLNSTESLLKRSGSAAKRSLRTSLEALEAWSCSSCFQALYSVRGMV